MNKIFNLKTLKKIVKLLNCYIARGKKSNTTIQQYNNTKPQRGFTLIELLIVIAIIGVLAVGVISVVNPVEQFQKARDAQRKSDLSQIQKALEIYHQDNGRYPKSSVAGVTIIRDRRTGRTSIVGTTSSYKIKGLDDKVVEWGSSWEPYMSILPKDPSSSKKYVYNTTSDGQTYYIYASLDRGENDPQACNSGNVCSNLPNRANCGGTCNYGVSSPNVSP